MHHETPLRSAFLRWCKAQPSVNAIGCDDCCNRSHFHPFTGRHKEDADVCFRERAWRDYVRLRDNKPYFPHESYDA